jgi:hypothetical protein
MPKRRLGFAWMPFTVNLSLASCVSPEELRREDEAACAGYGFHPGTDAFASCRRLTGQIRNIVALQG